MSKRTAAAVEEAQNIVVDDLFIAAKYAVAVPPKEVREEEDDNEISLSSSDDAQPKEENVADSHQQDVNNEPRFRDDDESVESDLDMARDLDRMMEKEESDTETTSGRKQPHQAVLTKNEIDAYSASLNDLQDKLRVKVTLSDTDMQHGQWEVAGALHHHMVNDRTVVVLSHPGGTLLEEGSALSIRKRDFPSLASMNSVPDYILLGSILEVFGPVSRPLYSIRFEDETPSKVAIIKKEAVVQLDQEGKEEDIVDDKPTSPSSPVTETPSASTPSPIIDPWSTTGIYTTGINSTPHARVYYLANGQSKATRLLDTAAIYQNSTRGCDASNVYDEEMDQSEIDFSDDEKERMAKARRKGRNGRGGDKRQHTTPTLSHSGTHVPQGFHNSSIGSRPVVHQYPSHFYQAPPYPTQAAPAFPQPPPRHVPPPPPPPPDNAANSDSDTEYYSFE